MTPRASDDDYDGSYDAFKQKMKKLSLSLSGSIDSELPHAIDAALSSSSTTCQHQHDKYLSITTAKAEDDTDSSVSIPNEKKTMTIPQRYALSIARNPTKHLSAALIVSVLVTVVVLTSGNIKLEAGTKGFLSRGTVIADRSTQALLLQREMGMGAASQSFDPLEDSERSIEFYCTGQWYGSKEMIDPSATWLNSIWKTKDADLLQPQVSALDANAMYEMCLAEESTLSVLEEHDLCYKCTIDDTDDRAPKKCLQPYSLVAAARLYLNFLRGIFQPEILVPSISCDDLHVQWTETVQNQFTSLLIECTEYMLELAGIKPWDEEKSSMCSQVPILASTIVDDKFLQSGIVRVTSSIYATKTDDLTLESLYKADRDDLFKSQIGHTGDIQIKTSFEQGVYESGMNALHVPGKSSFGFVQAYFNEILPKEVMISFAALFVTTLCILFHTRSPFITLLGLAQIMFALPWAYFTYYFICRISFFPFVNINSPFIVFALGADDIFVVVDKWKNTRKKLPHATTEEIAEVCLPDAAYSTFVTSITTSIAFFASAVVKVPSIALFAIYCGLVITFDYILCILLVFPALCMWDRFLLSGSNSILLSFGKRPVIQSIHHDVEESMEVEEDDNKDIMDTEGWSSRILSFYYKVMHKLRWPLLLLSLGAIIGCTFVAATLPPRSTPFQMFKPSTNNRYELHRSWSRSLMSTKMALQSTGVISFIWGLIPADTGNHFDPDDTSEFVLDPTFKTSSETQEYILDLCDRIHYDTDSGGGLSLSTPSENYTCVMKGLNMWLAEQSQLSNQSLAYSSNCQGFDGIPIAPDVFDSCMIAYIQLTNSSSVFHDNITVQGLIIQGKSNATFDSTYDEQEKGWNDIESWYEKEKRVQPQGGSFFYSSGYFWPFDTLRASRAAAYTSALIAISCASTMILLTSQSILVAIYAAISILYVLVASTACLVSLGWELGVFESILFSILIGIGCDFILHFGHCYTSLPGVVCKESRTRHAVLHMSPSVIGSAFTTMSTAVIMLFAENLFVYKFAMMLIMTITHSVIGSFFIFLVLCDAIGPSRRFPYSSVVKTLREKGTKVHNSKAKTKKMMCALSLLLIVTIVAVGLGLGLTNDNNKSTVEFGLGLPDKEDHEEMVLALPPDHKEDEKGDTILDANENEQLLNLEMKPEIVVAGFDLEMSIPSSEEGWDWAEPVTTMVSATSSPTTSKPTLAKTLKPTGSPIVLDTDSDIIVGMMTSVVEPVTTSEDLVMDEPAWTLKPTTARPTTAPASSIVIEEVLQEEDIASMSMHQIIEEVLPVIQTNEEKEEQEKLGY